MSGSYIVAGARTPIGKMSGALASFSAADLGGFAIAAALQRAGVAPHEVEHVIMGQVLMAGQGQVPSRQAASKAGIPMSVPSVNINKVCLSGLNSIYLANQMIIAGHLRRFQDQRRIGRAIGGLESPDRFDIAGIGNHDSHSFQLVKLGSHPVSSPSRNMHALNKLL